MVITRTYACTYQYWRVTCRCCFCLRYELHAWACGLCVIRVCCTPTRVLIVCCFYSVYLGLWKSICMFSILFLKTGANPGLCICIGSCTQPSISISIPINKVRCVSPIVSSFHPLFFPEIFYYPRWYYFSNFNFVIGFWKNNVRCCY